MSLSLFPLLDEEYKLSSLYENIKSGQVYPGYTLESVNEHSAEWFIIFRAWDVSWEEADWESHALIYSKNVTSIF